MSTIKHDEKEEEIKVEPEWYKVDMGKVIHMDRIKRIGELMNDAGNALQELKMQLEKAKK